MRPLQLTALVACAATILACDPTVVAEEDYEQGIRGTVIKYVGNFQCCTGKAFPISAPVHIVRGTVAHESVDPPPALESLPLELTVQSGEDGRFEALLAPGTYTVFTEAEGELYMNCHEAYPEGEEFCSVVVEELEFSELEISETTEAVE